MEQVRSSTNTIAGKAERVSLRTSFVDIVTNCLSQIPLGEFVVVDGCGNGVQPVHWHRIRGVINANVGTGPAGRVAKHNAVVFVPFDQAIVNDIQFNIKRRHRIKISAGGERQRVNAIKDQSARASVSHNGFINRRYETSIVVAVSVDVSERNFDRCFFCCLESSRKCNRVGCRLACRSFVNTIHLLSCRLRD